MLYKIAPFLVWFHSYGDRVGIEPVPALADLYSPRMQAAGYGAHVLALGILGLGTVLGREAMVRAGGIVWALSLLCLALNMGCILSHWFRPRRLRPPRASPMAPALTASLP
jgi:hypothetical protein